MNAVGNLRLLGTRQQQVAPNHAHVQHLLLARVAQRALLPLTRFQKPYRKLSGFSAPFCGSFSMILFCSSISTE